jgi:hypothetical protein
MRRKNMPTVVESVKSPSAWAPPAARPLDEAVWRAWVERGRTQDRRTTAAQVKAVKWTSITALLAAAGIWSQLVPFEAVVRFLVTASAMVVVFQAFQARHYAGAAVFGGLALIYNPLAPVFSFSGDWQRAVVVASAVPFVVSIAWPNGRNARTKSND